MKKDLSSGQILFREGAASRHITASSPERSSQPPMADRIAVLGRVGPGSFVGEMGTLVWAPRNGTARARRGHGPETLPPQRVSR